jgi:hypothetical protein
MLNRDSFLTIDAPVEAFFILLDTAAGKFWQGKLSAL